MNEFHINTEKWFKIIHDCINRTVLTVHPTSVILNDKIDLNAFIKIVTVYSSTENACRYVSGVVFKKDIANKFNPEKLSIGFSDDDPKNIEVMQKHFKNKPDNIVKTYSTAGGTKKLYN